MKFSKLVIDNCRKRTEVRKGFYKLTTVRDLHDFIKSYIEEDPEAPITFDRGNKDLVIERLETDDEVVTRLEPEFSTYLILKAKFED